MFDEMEFQFSKIYGDKVDEDDARIQYRIEQNGNVNRPVIEADMNRDDGHAGRVFRQTCGPVLLTKPPVDQVMRALPPGLMEGPIKAHRADRRCCAGARRAGHIRAQSRQ